MKRLSNAEAAERRNGMTAARIAEISAALMAVKSVADWPEQDVLDAQALPRGEYRGVWPRLENGKQVPQSSAVLTQEEYEAYKAPRVSASTGADAAKKAAWAGVVDLLASLGREIPDEWRVLDPEYRSQKHGSKLDGLPEDYTMVAVMYRDEDGSRYNTLAEYKGLPKLVFPTVAKAREALEAAGMRVPGGEKKEKRA